MDPLLVAATAQALGVTNLKPLSGGGQKYVAMADSPLGPVIVKLIELVPPHAALTLERARREVSVLSAISHPNVVQIMSPLVEIGAPTVAVSWLEELLDGDDLEARLGARADWLWTSSMALDVLNGLAAMHAHGFVHRDLSPRNVRCLANGTFKVMDPGLARLLARTTITGPIDPGTPGFMSPEHVSPGIRPSFASDVFCVGVLMYELLAGESPVPFTGDITDYVDRLRDDQAPSLGLLRPDLDSRAVDFVDTCLQRQLARRYLDGAEARAALAAI